MKKNILLFTLLFSVFLSALAQTQKDSIISKTNPILFVDATFGYTNGSIKGIAVGGSVNYQKKNNLYTFKAFSNFDYRDTNFIEIIPTSGTSRIIEEYSLLYGKRFVEEEFAYHFSGGISYNVYLEKERENIFDHLINVKDSYFGFPLEIGLSWFKSKKERFRVLYGLIPVGKPTGFGRSFGVKLYGNIAKKSYVGIGLSFGIGWHKKY